MKKYFYFIVILLLVVLQSPKLHAQGCVAVRQMGGNIMCTSSAYNLSKGEFQIGANYRYFHSWRHFVGTVEQPQRQVTGGGHGADGKDRGDAVNIYSHAADLNISYGITDRLQFNVSIPYVHNERSQVLKTKTDTTRYSVYAKGLGDIRFSVNYWIMDPAKAHKGNVMVGLGVKTNSGSHRAMDNAPQQDGTTKSVVMDQAIQPGDGGVGVSIEVQAFTQLYKGIYGFANGYYLFNPRQSNGTSKSAAKPDLAGYNVYASPDQYFARAGVMTSVLKSKKLTLSLAGRWEGIPAYDAFGGQVAYRRPGYVVAVESGISYREGKHSISLFVPYNFIKNRIQSAADIAETNLNQSKVTDGTKVKPVHGDAAFADYSINISYAYRIGKLF